jgi:hypothetical protein
MIRLASLFWLALVAVTGFATFKVKYTVQDIEDELNKVRRHTIAEQQEIHILRAEWTALNQPERLADLNRRFLSLAAVAPKQMQRKIEDIPLRPVPQPAEPLIAAAPEAAPPPQPAPADIRPGPDTVVPTATTPAGNQADAATVMPVAAAAKSAVANIQLIASAEAAPAAAPAMLKPTSGKPEARASVAKASPANKPRSLDRLISEIAESR